MFGQGMARKILSRLFNPFNLKIDLHLKTWLWSPLTCAGKALHGRVDLWDYVKIYTFNIFIFNILGFFTIITTLFFTTIIVSYFRKKSFIVDVPLGSKYVSEVREILQDSRKMYVNVIFFCTKN